MTLMSLGRLGYHPQPRWTRTLLSTLLGLPPPVGGGGGKGLWQSPSSKSFTMPLSLPTDRMEMAPLPLPSMKLNEVVGLARGLSTIGYRLGWEEEGGEGGVGMEEEETWAGIFCRALLDDHHPRRGRIGNGAPPSSSSSSTSSSSPALRCLSDKQLAGLLWAFPRIFGHPGGAAPGTAPSSSSGGSKSRSRVTQVRIGRLSAELAEVAAERGIVALPPSHQRGSDDTEP